MRVLGIDPGTKKCGYAIICKEANDLSIDEIGFMDFTINNWQQQIIKMSDYVDEIFTKFVIDEVVIETLFFAYNPKTVLKLAQFRGALAMKVLQYKTNFAEYTPLQIKQALTGNGKATKEQVAFMVSKIFGLKKAIKPFDVADAIAIALTHIQRI